MATVVKGGGVRSGGQLDVDMLCEDTVQMFLRANRTGECVDRCEKNETERGCEVGSYEGNLR